MAPRTRGKRSTANQAAVITPADHSTHVVSKKKKGKAAKTHPSLPPLVIKKPCANAARGCEVATGKHLLSPEEGPNAVDELGARASSRVPKPAKRVKAGRSEETCPPLELTTDEEDVGNVLPPTQASASHASVGRPPLKRTSQSAETLLVEDDIDDSSSLDNNCSHSSISDSSAFSSSEDELPDEPIRTTQSDRTSQKMAFERPSWLSNPTEEITAERRTAPTAPLTVPASTQPSMSSSRKPLPSQDQTSTQVHSEHQSVHAVATSEHQRGSRPRTRSEHPRTRTRARSERSRSRRSEVLTTTIRGQPAADTVSQHPRATASSVTGTEVPWVWPEDTNLRTSSKGNLLLTVQSSIVRKTISESFELLQAYLTFKHAFPDSILMNKFIEDALSTAALHVPNAEDVHVRILRDYSYCARMSYLPRARISTFRAEVKERCVASIVPLLTVLETPAAIAELAIKVKDDFNYIYPRCSSINPNVLIGAPQIGRPYRSTIILSAIRDLFFSGNRPFVIQHQDQFPSHQGTNGETVWEVPKPMVALVATAYYAALCEWVTGERRRHDFAANVYLDPYKSHILVLDKIEGKRPTTYHNMMADIYRFAVTGGPATAQPPAAAASLIDLTVLED